MLMDSQRAIGSSNAQQWTLVFPAWLFDGDPEWGKGRGQKSEGEREKKIFFLFFFLLFPNLPYSLPPCNNLIAHMTRSFGPWVSGGWMT